MVEELLLVLQELKVLLGLLVLLALPAK